MFGAVAAGPSDAPALACTRKQALLQSSPVNERDERARRWLGPPARRAAGTIALSACLCAGAACQWRAKQVAEMTPDQLSALHMLMPASVKIQPFTQIKSFDQDGIPDGIEVLIQPTDRLGDPVKVVGRFSFELYSHRRASADPKGEQLQFWEVTLDNDRDQRRFWDRTAQMYVFPLEVVPDAVVADKPALSGKFVLVATYHTPDGVHLSDELVLSVRQAARDLARRFRAGSP